MARLGRGQPNRPIITRAPSASDPSGTADIAVAFAVTAAGTAEVTGTATITAAVALSASGTAEVSGTATIATTVTLSATGNVFTGIGSVPRPRLRWQVVIGPASGGHQLALTEAGSRKMTFRLTEPSDSSVSLDGRHPQALAIDELSTDLHFSWTSDAGATQILDRHRVGTTQDSITGTTHTVNVTGLDYKAVLNRRRLYSGDTLTYAATDQAAIAAGLIASTQGNTGGNLGITWPGALTGVLRDRTYEAGDSVGERIQELSEVLDGFDWDITPTSASGLALDIWYPQRGVDRGVVLIDGGLVATANRDFNPGDYANAIRMTGEEALTAQEREAADIATVAQGRWDAAYGDTGLTTQAALNERADWQIAQAQVADPVWTVTLKRGGWDGPDHIWLGDPVRLIVKSGRLDTDVTLRVHELSVTLGASGEETIELTLGGRRPTWRRTPGVVERRLTNLERR